MRRILVRSLIYKLALLGFVSFSFYFFMWGEFGIAKHYGLQRELNDKKIELLALRDEVTGIEREIDRWKKDSFYLEKMAREELGLGGKGEVVYLYPSRMQNQPSPRS